MCLCECERKDKLDRDGLQRIGLEKRREVGYKTTKGRTSKRSAAKTALWPRTKSVEPDTQGCELAIGPLQQTNQKHAQAPLCPLSRFYSNRLSIFSLRETTSLLQRRKGTVGPDPILTSKLNDLCPGETETKEGFVLCVYFF